MLWDWQFSCAVRQLHCAVRWTISLCCEMDYFIALWDGLFHCAVRWIVSLCCEMDYFIVLWDGLVHCAVRWTISLRCEMDYFIALWDGLFHCAVRWTISLRCEMDYFIVLCRKTDIHRAKIHLVILCVKLQTICKPTSCLLLVVVCFYLTNVFVEYPIVFR